MRATKLSIMLAGTLLLAAARPSRAEPQRIALVIEGARSKAVTRIVDRAARRVLSTEGVVVLEPETVAAARSGAGPIGDETAKLCTKLRAARLIVISLEQRRGRFLINLSAVDSSGPTQRVASASRAKLRGQVSRLLRGLPPLPLAEMAAATPPPPTPLPPPPPSPPPPPPPPETPPAPPVAAPTPPPPPHKITPVPEPEAPAPPPPPPPVVSEPPLPPVAAPKPPPPKRRHDPGMLIVGGAVLVATYVATVIVAVHYSNYNANASRLGYYPLAGPLLARNKINSKDLNDGYDAGLITDGVLQSVAAAVLVAGIIYCAVGVPSKAERRAVPGLHIAPTLAASGREAHLGLEVTW